MKSIIEREAFFENNSDMEPPCYFDLHDGGQCNTDKMITSICKGNIMKQDMLNSQIHLTSQAPRGSLPSK